MLNDDDDDTCWQPGQYIPQVQPARSHTPRRQPTTIDPLTSPIPGISAAGSGVQLPVVHILQQLQFSVDSQLTKVNDTLSNIVTRLEAVEEKQCHLETELKTLSTTSQSTPVSSQPGKRNRLTPVALQVLQCRHVASYAIFFVQSCRVPFAGCIMLSMKANNSRQMSREFFFTRVVFHFIVMNIIVLTAHTTVML